VWVKYDSAVNALWADGTISGYAEIQNITTDVSGNLLIIGGFTSPTMQIGSFTLTNTATYSGQQYFVAKVSPSGTVLWAINDGTIGAVIEDGGANVWTHAGIATDSAGNIYITSSFQQPSITIGTHTLVNTDPSGTTYDVFVAKYTSAGVLSWVTQIGGAKDDLAYSIIVSSLGDVYITGDFLSPSMTVGPSVIENPYINYLSYIAKFSSSGAPLWAEGAGGVKGAIGTALAKDNFGNIYEIGGFGDTSISFGATTITRAYPPAATVMSSEFYCALFLVQYSPANTVTWSKKIEPMAHNATIESEGVTVSGCGQVWVCAKYHDSVLIDAGDTLALLSAPDVATNLIAGYDIGGNAIGYAPVLNAGDVQTPIASDVAGNILMCARVAGFPFTIGSSTLTGHGTLIAKYINPITQDTSFRHTDTTLCTTDLLTAPAGYTSYLWNNDSVSSSINVSAPGQYYVRCISCGTVLLDTFNVAIASPDTTYGLKDTTICSSGTTITLSGPSGFTSYLWSTGAATADISVSTAGLYYVSAAAACSIAIDTFAVSYKNIDLSFSLGADTTVCAPLTLIVPLAGVASLWQDGSDGSTYTVTLSGTYYVTVSDSGCQNSDTVNVIVDNVSQHLNDTTFCRENFSQYTLLANAPQGSTVLWSTGSTQQALTVSDTGIYWVTVTDGACTGSDTMILSTQLCNCMATLPTAFTPNNDNKDDTYYPLIVPGCNITGYSFSIFNRWGQLVFFSQDPTGRWDGKFGGVPADLGTYMYYLKYNSGLNNTVHELKGDVTLIR